MRGICVKEAAELCGGRLIGEGKSEILSVCIDNRELTPGGMFAAIKGVRVDGHDYIKASFQKGAVCCMGQFVPEGVSGDMIIVPDTEKALKKLAEAYRQRLNIPVIGIAGSVGKTTAKEMVASVLSQRFNVLKTFANKNNELGVPLTIFRIDPEHEAAVIEMGISDFGEMTRLAAMARPTMAVYTLIGHAHLEQLHDRPGVLKAKTEMLGFMPDDGVVFMNGDDDLLAAFASRQKKVLFGTGDHCGVRAENVHHDGSDNLCCDIVCGDRRFEVKTPAYGQHMVYAALEGAAVGIEFGLTDEEIIRGVAAFETVGRRARVIHTELITLIDDCYNANPDSVKCGINSLKAAKGRRVCVLGDMLGMGENGAELHADVGRYVAASGIDLLLTAGPLSENTAKAADMEAHHFPGNAELIAALPDYIKAGDTVLVKASNSMHFDEVSEALKLL